LVSRYGDIIMYMILFFNTEVKYGTLKLARGVVNVRLYTDTTRFRRNSQIDKAKYIYPYLI